MDATERIEAYLRAERADRLNKKMLPSEVRVIDALLANTLSMETAYTEIIDKAPDGFWTLRPCGIPWHHVVNTIVSTAAFFSPERLQATRDALRRVEELSADIERKAHELARLLRARADHCNAHGISRPDDYHPLDVITTAARETEDGYLFDQWVAPLLAPIRAQFGLKYWPRTADYLGALAHMQSAEAEPTDTRDQAAMDSRQGKSPRDFVRALDESLRELTEMFGIRTDLSHRTIAEIANCALALPPDEAMTRESVKALRAYQRRRG